MKKGLCALGLVSVIACSEQEVEEVAVSTMLAGEIHFGGDPEEWEVELYAVDDAGGRQLVDRVESGDGGFAIDVGYHSGTFYVVAFNSEQERVSAFVEASLDQRTFVVLTPVTHLAAVAAEKMIRSGQTIRDAIKKAATLVFGHFGGLAHDRIRPLDVKHQPAVSFTDDVAAGFLLEAFQELAASWATEAGRMRGTISSGRLLDALTADLAADGIFDGRGDRGAQLELAGVPFDGDVLRAKFGRALLVFADSMENVTAFGRADLVPMAEAIASNRGELFADGEPDPIDNVPPEFRRWTLIRGTAELPSDRALRGAVHLDVEVADDSAVDRITLRSSNDEIVMRGSPSARFNLDTTGLADGRNDLELIAADVHGNEGLIVVGIAVDNAPPVLRVDEIGRVAGSTVTIAGTVEDAGGVDFIRAVVAGTQVGSTGTVAGAFSFDAFVACGRRILLSIEAVDRAGNSSEVQREVLCDEAAPVIELLSSTFIQERSLEAIHSEDGSTIAFPVGLGGARNEIIGPGTAWPIRIEKYLNRLDDLDPFGSPGGPNIPHLRFRAIEVDGQAVASAWDALVVEYRYLVDGEERAGWRRLQPVGGLPQYEVPISYQALGPDLATGTSSTAHAVEVRVTDEAGLIGTRRFDFTVDLLSPPILISACTKSPVLGAFELGLLNMGVLYQTQPESEAIVGTVAYPLHLPPGSLAPNTRVRVALAAPSVVTRIIEISEDKHQANPNHPDNARLASTCWTGSHSEIEMPSGQYVGCFYGPMPLSRSSRRDPLGVNDFDAHGSRVEVLSNGGVVQPANDGRYLLAGDLPAEVHAFLIAPRIHFGGIEYDWRTNFTLPSGYLFGPHPARHRVDSVWREGIEYAPYGSFDPPRAYVTRAYVSELEIAVDPLAVSAVLDGHPDVAVDVQRSGGCAGPVLHRSIAP